MREGEEVAAGPWQGAAAGEDGALLEQNIARRRAKRGPTTLRVVPGGRSARP